jgi:DNA-3-methyladenine glycosylase II
LARLRELTSIAISDAEKHLRRVDAAMDALIARHGPCLLCTKREPAFRTLAWSIIGQQLSAKAATTITNRVAALIPHSFEPRNLLRISPDQLRKAGMSGRKASCLIALAELAVNGVLSFDSLYEMDDDRVIEELTQVPGIGRWTAEMFLIFGLRRPNVLSASDAGLQRAARMLYGEMASLERLGEKWAPWRSVASWYLWRHLDS